MQAVPKLDLKEDMLLADAQLAVTKIDFTISGLMVKPQILVDPLT